MSKSPQVMFRLSPVMLEQIDQYAAAASFQQLLGRAATRSEAIRSLLHSALGEEVQLSAEGCDSRPGSKTMPAEAETREVDSSSDLLVRWVKTLSLEESVFQWVVPYLPSRLGDEEAPRANVDPSVGHLCTLRMASDSSWDSDIVVATKPGIYFLHQISHFSELVVSAPQQQFTGLSDEDRAHSLKPTVLAQLRTWVHDHDRDHVLALLRTSRRHQNLALLTPSDELRLTPSHATGCRVLPSTCLRLAEVRTVPGNNAVALKVLYSYYLWAAWKQ